MEHVEHSLEHGTNYTPTERSGVREMIVPLNAMGDNVTIQKNWQELIRPSKLQVSPGGDTRRSATVVAEPLERGFGVTLGNALRRILLSSLQGAAVQSVHIDGVLHEFSSIAGVREDVTDIVLNIKDIAIKMQGDGPKRMVVKKQGPGTVTASDIQTVGDVVVLNPDLVLCTLDEGAEIRMNSPSTPARATCRPSATGRKTRRSGSSRSTASIRRCARFPTRWRTPAKARSSTTTS